MIKIQEEQRKIYVFFTNYYNHIIMLHMYEVFQVMIDKVGKVPLCNGRADRAPHIFGKCFILCWRCTSLIFSILLCSCLCYIFTGEMNCDIHKYGLAFAVILVIPTFVDGIAQYVFGVESTNVRRFLLGFISGVGLWMLASWADAFILSILNREIH